MAQCSKLGFYHHALIALQQRWVAPLLLTDVGFIYRQKPANVFFWGEKKGLKNIHLNQALLTMESFSNVQIAPKILVFFSPRLL